MLRVRGVLVGLVDGRPDEPWIIGAMLDAFEPATVPILTSHGGFPLGYLDTLTPWHGAFRAVAFTGSVTTSDPGIVAELQRGVAASLERFEPRSRTASWTPPRPRPHYRGRGGWYALVGVAMTDRPAAAGSWLMAEP